MNYGLIILTFISVNLDFFVMMLFLLRKYRFTEVLGGYLLGTILLVTISFVAGRFLSSIFPEWVLGILGFLPLWQALSKDEDSNSSPLFKGIGGVFVTYLSVCAGCNLSLFLPVLVNQSAGIFWQLILLVVVITVEAVFLVAGLGSLPVVGKAMDKWGEPLMRVCYVIVGCYVIYDSGLFSHLLQW